MHGILRTPGLAPALFIVFSGWVSLCWSTAASAHEQNFPVIEQISFALDCMEKNGGQNIETLYTCSCRIESLNQSMDFGDYEEAKIYKRFAQMPGERGGLFRESKGGDVKRKALDEVLANVERACPLVKRR